MIFICGYYKYLEFNYLLLKDAAVIKIFNFSLHYFRILKALMKCSAGEIHQDDHLIILSSIQILKGICIAKSKTKIRESGKACLHILQAMSSGQSQKPVTLFLHGNQFPYLQFHILSCSQNLKNSKKIAFPAY